MAENSDENTPRRTGGQGALLRVAVILGIVLAVVVDSMNKLRGQPVYQWVMCGIVVVDAIIIFLVYRFFSKRQNPSGP